MAKGEHVGPPGETQFIPATVARAVYERDNYECQFVCENGRRCRWPHELRLHNTAWSRGGASTVETLKVYCRCHDLYQPELAFGAGKAA